jgi:hypothetical protein
MKRSGRRGILGAGVSAALAASVAAPVPLARAVETPRDVETDHLDPDDDGGPRAVSLTVHGLAPVFGGFFGDVGIEAYVALAGRVALGAGGEWVASGAGRGHALSIGLPVFLGEVVFHGFFFFPHARWTWLPRSSPGRASADVSALVGYEWTAPFGATLRAGGGAGFAWVVQGDSGSPSPLLGFHPELDVAAGWVF